MKNHVRSFLRLVPVLVLALMLRTVSAQGMPPSGSFGYLLNATYVDPSNESGLAILGVINFDGAGNVTGTYTTEQGSSPTHSSQPVTGTFTGTYSSNADGTETLTTTADNGTTFTFAIVSTDSGQGLQFVATNCPCDTTTTTLSGVARAVYTGSLNAGSYGFQATNSPTPAASLGVLRFDGAGNVSMSGTFVGLSGASGQPNVFIGTSTGTYSSNPDGSGAATFTMANGNRQTYVFVSTDGGSGILFLQTNRAGNGVSFGTGRLQ